MKTKLMWFFFFFHFNSSSEGRPFRLGTGANMEKVVKMDRDMTKVRKGITKELFNIVKIGGQSEFLFFTDPLR